MEAHKTARGRLGPHRARGMRKPAEVSPAGHLFYSSTRGAERSGNLAAPAAPEAASIVEVH